MLRRRLQPLTLATTTASLPFAVRPRKHGDGPEFSLRESEVALTLRALAKSTGLDVAHEQKRFSLKYAKHHATLPEMKPQEWNHDKRFGVFSYEPKLFHNYGKRVTPRLRTHMNIWHEDTTIETNRFFLPYHFLNKPYHKLLGRESSFEAGAPDRRLSSSVYELTTDQRFKGMMAPALVNLNYEPNWNKVIYPRTRETMQCGHRRANAKRDAESQVVTTKASVTEWWRRLHHLVELHRPAVGDIGPQESRDIKKVHQFFTEFHDAMTGFEYQDAYLQLHLKETRPRELEDLFGIFLEMEGNYVNEDYCPRCSLPTATTRYCGEGDRFSPFRQWRGRYAPHKHWGAEWYDVVAARAEQLWYRATEDPWFGSEFHTQAQAENLLRVYCRTKQRGKANDFMIRLRGSLEFLTGRIVITEAMQEMFDRLLDTTPHPLLPTEATTLEEGAAKYLGEPRRISFSPVQFRVDMELAKLRRMQREEGVIRLPPKEWSLDTSPSTIPPVKVHPTAHHVTNWRSIKAGLEKSFLSPNLQKGAYAPSELREIAYLQARLASIDERRDALEAELHAAKRTLGHNGFVFPDSEWYRAFDKSDAALKPFGVKHGQAVQATVLSFADPSKVVATIGGNTYHFDTRQEATAVFGDYEYGQLVDLSAQDGTVVHAVILGVNKEGPSEQWELKALNVDNPTDVLALGTDVNDIAKNWVDVVRVGFASLTALDSPEHRRQTEEFEGSVVGVLGGRLYMQWQEHVAVAIGDAQHVKKFWSFTTPAAGAHAPHQLREPPSWNVPFRNDWSEERLQALQKAPWDREEWVSMIPNKYTPKPKQFGLAQHTTQDDFVTKEYKDRLTSRQFFCKPQAFSVIPDRFDSSVKFMGKSESLVTHGVPTVDRDELENGWDPVEPVPAVEVEAVEQCIRDISGRRPGNFCKTPKEKASVQLNESWWKPLQFGWEQRNEEQMLLHPSARDLTDPGRLPFGGMLPAHGTTHGIGERIRYVANDFAKGFDIGPNGSSPSAAPYDTLGYQAMRANVVGFSSVLVRMFNQKLGAMNEQQWASQYHAEDPKKLLIALNEWRMHGRPPAPVLARVLARYLKDEIADYNRGIPDGVAKLSLDENAAVMAATDSTANTLWADFDSQKYREQYRRDFDSSLEISQGSGDRGYLLTRFLAMNTTTISPSDDALMGHATQRLTTSFMQALGEAIGDGISAQAQADISADSRQGKSVRGASYARQLIRSQVLSRVLTQKLGFGHGEASLIVQALGTLPSLRKVQGDFAVPLQTLLAWKGPEHSEVRTGTAPTSKQAGAHVAGAYRDSRHGTAGGAPDMAAIMSSLVSENDGLALDLQYRARQNLRHDALREDFKLATMPLAKGYAEGKATEESLEALFRKYCLGLWAPNTAEVRTMVTSLLQRAAADREGLLPRIFVRSNVKIANFDNGGHPVIWDVQMPTFAEMPFEFENIAHERAATLTRFREWNIRVGEEARARIECLPATDADATHRSYILGGRTLRYLRQTPHLEELRQDIASKASALGPDVALLVNTTNDAPLAYFVNRFLYRFFPLLQLYWDVLQQYSAVADAHKLTAKTNHNQLTRILAHESNVQVEREFRQNAQKYWKSVIDSKGALAELNVSVGAGGGVRGSADGGGRIAHVGAGFRPRQQQQQQQQQQQDGARAGGRQGSGSGGRGTSGGGQPRTGLKDALGAGSGRGAGGARPKSKSGIEFSGSGRGSPRKS